MPTTFASAREFAEHHAGCPARNGRIVAWRDDRIVLGSTDDPLDANWQHVVSNATHGAVSSWTNVRLLCGDDHAPGANKPPPRQLTAKEKQDWRTLLAWAKRLRKARAPRGQLRLAWATIGRRAEHLGECSACHGSVVRVSSLTLARMGRLSVPHLCGHCQKCTSTASDCCTCVVCSHCHRRLAESPDVFEQRRAELICDFCGTCKSCCACPYCSACRANANGYYCRHCLCGRCCCRCTLCAGCCGRLRVPQFRCFRCASCAACCSCHNLCFVPPPDPLVFHAAQAIDCETNGSPRYLAAEIEIAATTQQKFLPVREAIEKWQGAIVYDGSLPETGFEINTAPASGDLYLAQVKEICAALAAAEARITPACGLHVHVDARDFDFYGIRRLVRLYAAMETALFEMVPPERRANRYCIPCGAVFAQTVMRGRIPKDAVKKSVVQAVYKADLNDAQIDRLKQNKYIRGVAIGVTAEARYYALNLHSWFFRGTVECRLFNGTVDAQEIGAWGMLWARILDRVAVSTDEEIDEVAAKVDGARSLSALVKSSRSVVLGVAGDDSVRAFVEARWQRHTTP